MTYTNLYSRNLNIIPPETQAKISQLSVYIGGCGSTGGAAIDGFLRLGVTRFQLSDNGCYELNNLNRQMVKQEHIGLNKALVQARSILAVNPEAHVKTDTHGVLNDDLRESIGDCDFIFDAIDVTTESGMAAKLDLHREAFKQRKAVISSLDLGFTQWIKCFNYHKGETLLSGRMARAENEKNPLKSLFLGFCNIEELPLEITKEVILLLNQSKDGVAQLACACFLLSALMTPYTLFWLKKGSFPPFKSFDLLEDFESDKDKEQRKIETQSVHFELKKILELES